MHWFYITTNYLLRLTLKGWFTSLQRPPLRYKRISRTTKPTNGLNLNQNLLIFSSCISFIRIKTDNNWPAFKPRASLLKCLLHEKIFLLIWKAFRNTKKWRFSFWNIFFRFRDIDIFLLCKLVQWWRHLVCN